MKTDNLINAIAADAKRSAMPLKRAWLLALPVSVVLAAMVFGLLLGPRADLMAVLDSGRFLFKFVLTGALFATALVLLRALAVPGAKAPLPILLIAPALALAAVLVELVVLPSGAWAMAAIGKNAAVCLTFIPLMGLLPLIAMISVLRLGAPTRPVLAGAMAGLTAGGLAAIFYAAHCTDDSPLFVAIWYSMAISILGIAGAGLGRLVIRW